MCNLPVYKDLWLELYNPASFLNNKGFVSFMTYGLLPREEEYQNLLSSYRNGNSRSFDKLASHIVVHARYFASINPIKVRLTDEIFDIASDSALKVIDKISKDTFESNKKIIGYIRNTVRNRFVDYYRKRKKNPLVSRFDYVHPTERIDDNELSDQDLDELILKKNIIDECSNLISSLDSPDREIFQKRYYEDMSFRLIGEDLSRPLGTIQGRHHYKRIEIQESICNKFGLSHKQVKKILRK